MPLTFLDDEPVQSEAPKAPSLTYLDDGPKLGTTLNSDEEPLFQQWKGQYAPNDSGSDYDLRGAFKAGIKPEGERGHFPDTYKLPNHPTFSEESKYSNDTQKGGKWGTDANGKDTFAPSSWMASDPSRLKSLQDYFKRNEPEASLILSQTNAPKLTYLDEPKTPLLTNRYEPLLASGGKQVGSYALRHGDDGNLSVDVNVEPPLESAIPELASTTEGVIPELKTAAPIAPTIPATQKATYQVPQISDEDVVTERQKAQDALALAKKRYEGLLHNSADPELGAIAAQAQNAYVREAALRAQKLSGPNAKSVIQSEKVHDAFQNSPLGKQFNEWHPGEDVERGFAGLETGLNYAYQNLLGTPEAEQQAREAVTSTGEAFPGTTDPSFAGQLIRGSSEMAGQLPLLANPAGAALLGVSTYGSTVAQAKAGADAAEQQAKEFEATDPEMAKNFHELADSMRNDAQVHGVLSGATMALAGKLLPEAQTRLGSVVRSGAEWGGINTVQDQLDQQLSGEKANPMHILEGVLTGAAMGSLHAPKAVEKTAIEPADVGPELLNAKQAVPDDVLVQKAQIHQAKQNPDTNLAAEAVEQKLLENVKSANEELAKESSEPKTQPETQNEPAQSEPEQPILPNVQPETPDATGDDASAQGGTAEPRNGDANAIPESGEEPAAGEGEVNSPEPAQGAVKGPIGSTHAETERQREALNLPEIVKQAPREIRDSFDRARTTVENNPAAPHDLVAKLSDEGPRPLTDEEQALLTHHTVTLTNGIGEVEKTLGDENSTQEEKNAARIRLETLTQDLNKLHKVNMDAGSEWGRSGRWRQQLLNQDYTLARVLEKSAKFKGSKLTPEETLNLTKLAKEHEAAAKDYEEKTKAKEESVSTDAGERVIEGVKKTASGKKVTAEESEKSVEQKIKDALARKAALKGGSDEVQSSTPILGEPPQEVTTEHQKQAVSDLQKNQVGKNLLKGALIVPDWERAISHSELRSFSSDEINRIKQSEGFFDPQSGKVVVIRENIAPREGETGEQALKRVLIHERVGHEGSRWMLDNDPQFRKAWHEAAAKIPQVELDKISEEYKHLQGNSDQLIGEWFARQVENLKRGEEPDPKTTFGKMWQAIKEFLIRNFGSKSQKENLQGLKKSEADKAERDDLNNRVWDLANAIMSNPDAFEGRSGLEGDLEAQYSLKPEEKNSLSDIPHSVLADLARHVVEFGHKAGEKMTEPELTKGMHDILKKSVPDVTESEVRRAHSKYGRVVNPTRDDIEKETNDLKAQQRLVEARTDAENNIRPKKTGAQREKPSQAQRDLDKQVRDLVKEKEEQKKFGEEDVANARATALDAVKSRLNNTIEDLEKDIKDLESGKEVRNRQRTPVERDAEANRLQDRVNSLRAERDNLKGAPELNADQWNKRMIAATKRVTEELERRVKEKDFDAKKKPSFEANAELEAARKARDESREALHQNEDYKKNAEQQAIGQIKRRLATRVAEGERRLRENDVAPKPKKSPYSDNDIELSKIRLKKIQQKIRNEYRKSQLASRTGSQKFWDNMVKVKRALVLSSVTVYGKLAAAAAVRGGLTGVEDLQGSVLKRILPKAVTDKALIESGSSPKALAKGYTDAFMKGLNDSVQTVKTGQSDLDLLHGKPKAEDEIWSSLLGRFHGAIKAPVKRGLFEYALKKQAENYIAQGVDITEPLIQAKMATRAYEYANKGIFMQNNALTDSFNLFLNNLSNKGGGAAGLSRALRILLPIVKVPTNIAIEAGTYVGGVPLGLHKLAKTWKKGFEGLNHEEADLILNQLKKGSLGAGLLLMGFFNPQMFGGYYQKGVPRKKDEADYGGAKVDGKDIPKWLLHSPAFEILQVGSTVRRVAESRLGKHGEERGLTSGALAGAMGLASEVPFVSEMLRAGDLQSPEGREKWLGELAKAQIIPAALDQLARARDKDSAGNPIKRQTKTFSDIIKSGIPGQREKLPIQKPKR